MKGKNNFYFEKEDKKPNNVNGVILKTVAGTVALCTIIGGVSFKAWSKTDEINKEMKDMYYVNVQEEEEKISGTYIGYKFDKGVNSFKMELPKEYLNKTDNWDYGKKLDKSHDKGLIRAYRRNIYNLYLNKRINYGLEEAKEFIRNIDEKVVQDTLSIRSKLEVTDLIGEYDMVTKYHTSKNFYWIELDRFKDLIPAYYDIETKTMNYVGPSIQGYPYANDYSFALRGLYKPVSYKAPLDKTDLIVFEDDKSIHIKKLDNIRYDEESINLIKTVKEGSSVEQVAIPPNIRESKDDGFVYIFNKDEVTEGKGEFNKKDYVLVINGQEDITEEIIFPESPEKEVLEQLELKRELIHKEGLQEKYKELWGENPSDFVDFNETELDRMYKEDGYAEIEEVQKQEKEKTTK